MKHIWFAIGDSYDYINAVVDDEFTRVLLEEYSEDSDNPYVENPRGMAYEQELLNVFTEHMDELEHALREAYYNKKVTSVNGYRLRIKGVFDEDNKNEYGLCVDEWDQWN